MTESTPASAEATDPGPSFRWRNLFVCTYLFVQLTLPIKGFVHDKLETRGEFSWNMYAHQYSCKSRYVLLTPDGRGELLDLHDYFATDKGPGRIAHEDRLPAFNAWLCGELERQGRFGLLKASIECTSNYAEPVMLVERYTDLCLIEPAP